MLKPRQATGAEFAALMQRYGLRSNRGAVIAARLLRVTPATIQSYYSKGLLRNSLELLEFKLPRRKSKDRTGHSAVIPPIVGG